MAVHRSGWSRIPALLATVVWVCVAVPGKNLHAQAADARTDRAARGTPTEQDEPPVPQTFDWHLDVPLAPTTPWGQPVDTAATRLIRSWTTRPEYINEQVDHIPLRAGVVSPTRHFGHPVGRPGVLHKVDEIHGYFDALAASTPRVRFTRLGETEEGRRLALAQIGSEENLARLEEIKSGLNALADPRVTSAEEARRLIADLPVIYTFYAGLHSPETGPPEMVMEMAYRLAVSADPAIRRIRDEVVVFIVPVAEPDGRDRVVDWHRRHNRDAYTMEDRAPGPPYWGSYIFHDNNRDGLQQSARLTRELTRLFLEWKHPIGHDLHESVPYLYVSTGTGPYNPTVDPITVSEWQWMSNYTVAELTSDGLPGVWNHNFYTGWYPGYLLWVTNTRNAVGRFYETFGNSVPNTMERTLESSSTSVEWYRANPPRDTTVWSLRNNTNYMQAGALSDLELVAQNRARVLENFWRKSNNSLEKGRSEAPYAWVVPAEQDRRADAAYMLNLLRRQGIEIHRAVESGTFEPVGTMEAGDEGAEVEEGSERGAGAGELDEVGRTAAAGAADPDGGTERETSGGGTVEVAPGDYVVRMDQPYRNFILTLMREQEFPEDAPAPYDDVAWTYPLMFNVTAHAVDDPDIRDLGMEAVEEEVGLPGRVRRVRSREAPQIPDPGNGDSADGGPGPTAFYLVQPNASAHSISARLALGSIPVRVAEERVELEEETLAPGAWIVRATDLSEGDLNALTEAGFDVLEVGERPLEDAATHEMDLPRIAILHTWSRTQDEGWTRFTFDHFGVPFTYVGEDEIGAMGSLRDRFDVIVFPHQGARNTAKNILQGIDPGEGPLAYTRTEEFPSHGHPDSSEDITGGMGLEGVLALREFVEQGGTLVTIGSASTIPVEFGFLREVGIDGPGQMFVPGSILRAEVVNDESPVTYGYDETFPVYHQWGPYLQVSEEMEAGEVVRYSSGSELLLSGIARNAGGLGGDPVVYVEGVGEGHVVAFGFDATHRFQTHGNFALLWNALLNWNDLGIGLAESEVEGPEDDGEAASEDPAP